MRQRTKKLAGTPFTSMRQLAFLAPLLAAGCATPYVAPASAPTATVVFSSSAPESVGVMVQAFADRKCAKNPGGTRVAYFFRSLFDDRNGAAKEVAAGREFVFTLRSRADDGVVANFCAVTKSFVPEPSQTYRAHFAYAADACDVEVTRVPAASPESGPAAPVALASISPVCLNDFDG